MSSVLYQFTNETGWWFWQILSACEVLPVAEWQTVPSSSMSIQIKIAANRNRDPRDRGKKRKTVVAKEALGGTNIFPAKAEPTS